MGMIAYYVSSSFAKEVSNNKVIIYASGVIATTYYIINPITAHEVLRIGFLWSMTFMPLFFYFALLFFSNAINFSWNDIIRRSVFLGVIMFLIVGPHWELFTLIVLIFCFLSNIQRPFKKYFKNSLMLGLFSYTIHIVLSFYWIFPLLKQIRELDVLPQPSYVVTYEIVDVLSKNASLLNVLRGVWYWLLPSQFVFNTPIEEIHTIATILIPLFVFSILLHPRNKDISITIFTLILLIFSTGSYYSVFSGKFYDWLIFDAPFFSSVGWILRNPGRWMMLVTSCYLLLLTRFSIYFLEGIDNLSLNLRFRKLFLVFAVSLLLFIIVMSGLPTLRTMNPESLPDSYIKVNRLFEGETEYYKLLAFPEAPLFGFSKPTLSPDTFLEDVILENKSNQLGKLLGIRNIKYILVGTTFYGTELDRQELSKLLSIFQNQEDLELLENFGGIYVFENKKYLKNVYITDQMLVIQSDLAKIISLLDLHSFDPKTYSVLFADQNRLAEIPWYADILVLNFNQSIDLIASRYEKAKIITTFGETDHHKPSKYWSKAKTSDPLHGEWHPNIEKFGIENWQFDYGEGLVFTWATNATLKIRFNIEKDDYYILLVRYFGNKEGGMLGFFLDDHLIKILKTKSQINNFLWRELGTFKLTKGEHSIVIKNIEGLNAVNIFVLLQMDDYAEITNRLFDLIKDKTLIYILEAEADLYRENTEIVNSNNASNGKFLAFFENSTAWQTIEILREGLYKIALKLKGEFELTVDNKKFRVNSTEFNFVYLDAVYLSKGQHTFRLKPLSYNSCFLDVVWLYSVKKGNETLKEIFSVKRTSAKMVKYRMINPTKWVVEVYANTPFMLAFAEKYNPLWFAELDNQEYESIPLYGTINGFWINKSGILTIYIVYKQQEWFKLGSRVTVCTLIICLIYLVHEWKKYVYKRKLE